MKKENRPINIGLTDILFRFQWTWSMVASVLHRVSGIALIFVIPIFIYGLQESLNSQESFDALKISLTHPILKFVIWVSLSFLVYHFIAGIKHLIMDLGFGETKAGGKIGAKITLISSTICIIALAYYIS